MAQPSSKKFFTAADPDGPAYEEAMRQQRAINEARERELLRRGGQAQKVADTAQLAGDVTTAAELAPAGVAAISRSADDLEAARAVSKVTGPLGHVLSAVAASEGFKADRAKGMPLDEAFIKHGGGLALGAAFGAGGAVLGSAAGAPGGPAVAFLGGAAAGALGAKGGEKVAEGLAMGWGQAKRGGRRIQAHLGRISDPYYWYYQTHSPYGNGPEF